MGLDMHISNWVTHKEGDWTSRLATGLLRSIFGRFIVSEFLVRLTTDSEKFSLAYRDQIEISSRGPEQSLALGPNLVPFLEHNDGNRVLIGANILRQSLSTLWTSTPRISSGIDVYISRDRGQNLRSYCLGLVFYVSAQRIIIRSNIYFGKNTCHYKRSPFQDSALVRYSTSNYLTSKKYNTSCCIEYRLGGIFRSNQSTWRWQRICVKEGIWILSGELLADGSSRFSCQISVGHNFLLRYVPWDGLNFEDSVVATTELFIDGSLTSIHVENLEAKLQCTPFGIEVFVPVSSILANFLWGRKQKSLMDSSTKSIASISISRYKENNTHLFFWKRYWFSFRRKKWRCFSFKKVISKYIFPNTLPWNSKYHNSFFFRRKEIIVFFKVNIIVNYPIFSQSLKDKKKKRRSTIFPGFDLLDNRGIVYIGTWVETDQILAIRIRPIRLIASNTLMPYERLLLDILSQERPVLKDTSFRVPRRIKGRILDIEALPCAKYRNNTGLDICWKQYQEIVEIVQTETVCKLVNSVDERKFIPNLLSHLRNKNCPSTEIKLRFMNLHMSYDFFVFGDVEFLLRDANNNKHLTNKLKIGRTNNVKKGDASTVARAYRAFEKFEKTRSSYSRNHYEVDSPCSFRRDINYAYPIIARNHFIGSFCSPHCISILLIISIHRRVQVGDKLAGRHGNKGILSRLVPSSEMPYFSTGLPLNLILNPLGIPSRMNVGQIYEATLRLAGFFLGEQYLILNFDERGQI